MHQRFFALQLLRARQIHGPHDRNGLAVKFRHARHELGIANIFRGGSIQFGLKIADSHTTRFDPAEHGHTDVPLRINPIGLVHDFFHFETLDHDQIVRPQEIG